MDVRDWCGSVGRSWAGESLWWLLVRRERDRDREGGSGKVVVVWWYVAAVERCKSQHGAAGWAIRWTVGRCRAARYSGGNTNRGPVPSRRF
jgi:hypothetical protein